jgi:hypothetical protein
MPLFYLLPATWPSTSPAMPHICRPPKRIPAPPDITSFAVLLVIPPSCPYQVILNPEWSHPSPLPNLGEVLSSAAEAELAAVFHNGKEACPFRAYLEELGHPQPPTPIQTNNSTAAGIANESVKQKRSKAIDMHFYWIRDRVGQGQFFVCWNESSLNKADYFTNHHPASHHQAIRSSYLHSPLDRSKNYFVCLQDSDDAAPTSRAVTFATDVTKKFTARCHVFEDLAKRGPGIPVRLPK